MMKLKWIALLTALIILLPACGGSSGETIKYDIPSGVSTLDPQFATDSAARMIISNTFEGLYRQLPSGEVVPCLAESYELSSDGLTYTFHLRRDSKWTGIAYGKTVRWAGGESVTAHDFAFALSRMFDPSAFSPFASEFSSIKNAQLILQRTAPRSSLGVRALDDFTLQIELIRPDNLLLERLAASYSVPCNSAFFESTKARYGLDLENLIFNGPFYVRSWDNTSAISLRQNKYHMDNSSVATLGVNLYISDGDTEKRFLNGDTDAAKVGYDLLDAVLAAGGQSTSFEDTVWVLLLNNRLPYFSNAEIRRAVASSVDRSLFEDALPENFRPTAVLIPPAVSSIDGSFREKAGNTSPVLSSPELAKRHFSAGLAELGLDKIPFDELLVCDSPGQQQLAGYLQQGFQRSLSLFASLTVLPEEELTARLASGDFQAAVVPLSAAYSSPAAILSRFYSGYGTNDSGYTNEIFDGLLASTATLDSDGQYEAYRQAEQLLLENGGAIPLFFETSYYATAKGVSGVAFSPFLSGVYFKDARKR